MYLCNPMQNTTKTILYIHGMGGGADSRIPSILSDALAQCRVVCRTYDFNPKIAHGQIEAWIKELRPDLVIGESLGALHALRVKGVPLIFVSPALNAALYLNLLSLLTWIPGVSRFFAWRYKPREGDRQPLNFSRSVLKEYREHARQALDFTDSDGRYIHAYFGAHDHYRRDGIVSIRRWKKLFGETFSVYDGTHFMENKYVYSMLIPDILRVLNIK